MSELKPCPFCGGKAIKARQDARITSDYIEFSGTVECVNCGVKMDGNWFLACRPDVGFAKNETIEERWNRRAGNE